MNLTTKVESTPQSGDPVEQAVQTILDTLNNVSGSARRETVPNAILATLRKEHRTIQQSFWSAILLSMMKYADVPFDGRNEQSVEFAKKVRELAREQNFDIGGFQYI